MAYHIIPIIPVCIIARIELHCTIVASIYTPREAAWHWNLAEMKRG